MKQEMDLNINTVDNYAGKARVDFKYRILNSLLAIITFFVMVGGFILICCLIG